MEMRKDILAKAAIAMIVLFAASLYVGYAIESDNYAKVEDRINGFQDELENALLFTMFLQTHNESASVCSALSAQLEDSAQYTYDIYGELEQSKGGVFRQYETLRSKYFLANMRFYLLLRQYKQACNDTALEPILFFYSAQSDCPSCAAQGKVLDDLRASCGNARVYAFPVDVQGVSMIKAFKSYYNITSTPALVIRDRTYQQLEGKDSIAAKIGCAG
ncbi:Uncharacterised protein [uncultured archaeon]|nr:Uncharacterised protein [uncultured archaeon]